MSESPDHAAAAASLAGANGASIPKAYEPAEVEARWYPQWVERGAFSARARLSGPTTQGDSPDGTGAAGNDSPSEATSQGTGAQTAPATGAYCIVIPPPNVTGILHLGHVLNNTIQDILCRRARLEGKAVLWQPGTDHASIATASKVEAQLRANGQSRHDLGREAFVEACWNWSKQYGGTILQQLKRLGASCDWERTVFTMDPHYERAVLTAFVKLYQRGYIYRGKRMVNWCPKTLTALSDEEVIMKPQQGLLYKMRYEIAERPGEFVEISTTRPETLMGDTAVAIHPDDERYRHLHGLHLWRPFPREKIPFVLDEAVDREFGTGVLKVTPAHDPADFAIGQRHSLSIIDVFNPDGTLNALAGEEFAGMDRFKARKVAAEKLRAMGLLVAEEKYENSVGFSERGDVPIEPRLSEQWWMRYPKIEEAKAVVREGLIRFWPARWVKTYLHWLENIQDWCISRQLWWGQRIPVWYRQGADRSDPANLHVSVEGPPDPENWEQEEDVLDTWASSWLWPFATLGWPDPERAGKENLPVFYPTSALVTGPDILFFWVARMIVAGLEFMPPDLRESGVAASWNAEYETLAPEALPDPGSEARRDLLERLARQIPFRDVYFTGIIRDPKGRKMSKSLGNSPDPLDLMDRYGADGLRFGIMSIAPKGQDILFNEERIEQGRNFCNKLWNACRFRQMSGPAADNSSLAAILRRIEPDRLDDFDRWILGRALEASGAVEEAYAHFEFNHIIGQVYTLFWSEFCDVYLEVSKSRLQDEAARSTVLAVQDLLIREILLLLEPFTPFITEELWHQLGYGSEGTLMQDTKVPGSLELAGLLAPLIGIESPTDALRVNPMPDVETAFAAAAQGHFDNDPARAIESGDSSPSTDAPGSVSAQHNCLAAAVRTHSFITVSRLIELVTRARALKADYNLAARRDVRFQIEAEGPAADVIEAYQETLCRLIGAERIERVAESPGGMPASVVELGTLYLNLAASVDVEAERRRLEKELERLNQVIQNGEAKLKNERFVSSAPPEVVQGARQQLADNQAKKREIERLIASFSPNAC